MDHETLTAAATLLETHARAGEPIREILLRNSGNLAIHGESNLGVVQAELEASRLNKRIIDDVVQLLPVTAPTTRFGEDIIALDDEYTAKTVQANTVLYSGYRYNARIYYILGERRVAATRSSKDPTTDLLLWPAKAAQEQTELDYPISIQVLRADLQAFKDRSDVNISANLSEVEIKNVIDPKTSKIIVANSDQKAGLPFSHIEPWKPWKPRRPKTCAHNGNIRCASETTRSSDRFKHGISDADIESFGVFDRINELASDFGVSQKVVAVLRQHAFEQNPPDEATNILSAGSKRGAKHLKAVGSRILRSITK